MKNYKPTMPKNISMVIVICFLAFSVNSCGDSNDGNSGPGPNPPPQGESFDSGSINPGTSFSYTFDQQGVSDYMCTIHPSMEGTVTVETGAGNSQDTVIIDDLQFTPSTITIAPGTEVTWINRDDVTHTSTSQ